MNWKLAWYLPLAITVAACSGKGKVREPTPLQPLAESQASSSTIWSRHTWLGRDFSQLQVAAQPDAVFVSDQHGEVEALDPESGARIWRNTLGVRASAGPGVLDALVVVGTLDGEVIALSRADGVERWRKSVSSEVMAVPVGAGQLLVIRTVDGRIYGLNSDTGEEIWQFERTVPNLTLRGLSEPTLLAGRVFVGLDSGRMASLEGLTGRVVWEQLISAPTGRTELERIADIDAPIATSASELFVASAGGEVVAVEGETGQILWRRPVRTTSSMAVVGEHLIVTDTNGVVWGLDTRTGSADWKQEGLQYRGTTAPTAQGSYVVVGDMEGYLHWLEPTTGAFVGRGRFGSKGFQGVLATLDDHLIVQRGDGRVGVLQVQ
jgi:outer membrane protein assembly factor BamB